VRQLFIALASEVDTGLGIFVGIWTLFYNQLIEEVRPGWQRGQGTATGRHMVKEAYLPVAQYGDVVIISIKHFGHCVKRIKIRATCQFLPRVS